MGTILGTILSKVQPQGQLLLSFFPNFSLALFKKMLLIKKHKSGCFRFYLRKKNCKLKNTEYFLNNLFSMFTLQTLKIVPSAEQRRLYVIMIKKLFQRRFKIVPLVPFRHKTFLFGVNKEDCRFSEKSNRLSLLFA